MPHLMAYLRPLEERSSFSDYKSTADLLYRQADTADQSKLAAEQGGKCGGNGGVLRATCVLGKRAWEHLQT